VINDAYNANPQSMTAALRALAAMGAGRRTWAVLGQMAELGDRAGPEHAALGGQVNDLGIDRLVAVGPQTSAVHAGAVQAGLTEERSSHVPDIDAALRLLHTELRPGDVVLVKASRAAGLERLALELSGEDA
jgi:UDP-N-acetylmuramoyl-tripeptide--D-alanyl-D-alanine ligase